MPGQRPRIDLDRDLGVGQQEEGAASADQVGEGHPAS